MESKTVSVRFAEDKVTFVTECECGGTGFIPVPDVGGDGVDYVECAKHNPAYQDPRSLK